MVVKHTNDVGRYALCYDEAGVCYVVGLSDGLLWYSGRLTMAEAVADMLDNTDRERRVRDGRSRAVCDRADL